MDIRQRIPTPAALRAMLDVRTRGGVVRLSSILAPFQLEALDVLDRCIMAVANDQAPPVRNIYWEWSKGASKTTLIATELLWYLLTARIEPVDMCVGAGDLQQAGEVWSVIAALARLNPWLTNLIDIQSLEIRRKGSPRDKLERVPFGAPTLHGGRPGITWVDEFVHIPETPAGEDYLNTLEENQRKLGGLFIVSSNAGHLGTWQFRYRNDYLNDPAWRCSVFAEPAPWLPPSEVAPVQRRSPMVYRRLYCGEWIEAEGTALRYEDIEAAVCLAGPQLVREEGWVYAIGVDAGIERDATGLVVVGKRMGRYKVCKCRKWLPTKTTRVAFDDIEQAIKDDCDCYAPVCVAFDPQEMRSTEQRLIEAGLPMRRVDQGTKFQVEAATMLLDVFSGGAIDLYRDEQLLSDLRRLKLKEMSYGIKVETNRGRTGHGDLADALEIALVSLADVHEVIFGEPNPALDRDSRSVFASIPPGVFGAGEVTVGRYGVAEDGEEGEDGGTDWLRVTL